MESFTMISSERDGVTASGRRGAVRELARSIELGEQLQRILASCRGSTADSVLPTVAGDLVGEFLALVSGALPALASETKGMQLLQGEPAVDMRGAGGKIPTSKKQASAATKRRRAKETRMVTTSTPLSDDGFAWKKYGQKAIYGAKYPKSYFKCSQWSLNGCPATKQVQQRDEDPSKFAVTYIHNHTCQLQLETDSLNELFTIDFESGKGGCQFMSQFPQNSSFVAAIDRCIVGSTLELDQIDASTSGYAQSTYTEEYMRHSNLQVLPPVYTTTLTASTGSCDSRLPNFNSSSPMSPDISSVADSCEFMDNFFWSVDQDFIF